MKSARAPASARAQPALTCCLLLQKLTNTGQQQLNVPYTLAVYSPSYTLIAGQGWNWGVSGSATNGTFSGPVSLVRLALLCGVQRNASLLLTITMQASCRGLGPAVPRLRGRAGARPFLAGPL